MNADPSETMGSEANLGYLFTDLAMGGMKTHADLSRLTGRAPLLALAGALALACATSGRPPAEAAAPTAPTEVASPAPTPAAPPPAFEPPRSPPLRPLRPEPPGVKVLARAELSAVGDVLMHGAVKDAAADHRTPSDPDGFSWLWAPVADLLGASDLTFANLETPVAPRAGHGTKSFVFNAPPTVPVALRRAGVKLVSVANNHAFDQGRKGFEETLAEVAAAGLLEVGAGEEGREAGPRFVEVNGLRLAFLGYAQFFNQDGNACPAATKGGPPCLRASVLDPDRAVEDVRRAAAAADAVVVSLHWGEEYHQSPREEDVLLAHRLAEAGALLVLGHHPHVLQPIELYPCSDGRLALIAYSLGNFISNQSRNYESGVTPDPVAAPRDGALLRVEIVRRDYGRGVTRVELGAAGFLPLWTENDTADPERRLRGTRPAIQVVSLDRALAAVRSRLSELPDPVPPEEAKEYIRLRRREELYQRRVSAIAEVLGEDLELKAPPPPERGEERAAEAAP